MKWSKKGLIFVCDYSHEWNQGYASVPTIYKVDDTILRIYYTSRDLQNRSNISFIEVQANDLRDITYTHDKPILSYGETGTFDDTGVMVSQVFDVGDEVWMYYIGWNIRNTIPYHNSIGLAISKDGGVTFKRFSNGPLFDRTYKEPYFSSTPYILIEKNIWKMWYLSTIKWIKYNDKIEAFYHIKYAESKNGIDWNREGRIAIDFKNKSECGLARPCIIKDDNIYKMWYSYRSIDNYRIDRNSSYRIGYAYSDDGINWIRKDENSGIDISEAGWDSQMIEYPFIYEYQDRRYMVYNGNSFGKSGFGYAVMEKRR